MPSFKPERHASVTPWIIGKDTAGLIDFVKAAFDAVELARAEPAGQ